MKLHFFYLVVLITVTIAVGKAQNVQQVPADAVNLVQDNKLETLKDLTNDNRNTIQALTVTVNELVGSLNRFTGIGIGIGCTLTILQIAQLWFTAFRIRQDGKRNDPL